MIGAQIALASLTLLVTLSLIELAWFVLWRRQSYPWADVAASIGVNIGRRLVKFATAGLTAPIFFAVWDLRLWHLRLDDPLAWAVAFFMLEFSYYWQHRMGHEVRWLWAAHRTHHSANQLNLPAAIRLSWTGLIAGNWLFYLPMVWLGVHPLAVFLLLAMNLTYQFWLHTELVPRLGPLEWLLNTPSHHRVHHAVNPAYLDRNYGGVVILFDRLFGTFAAERPDMPCRYGLVTPETSRNPFVIALREYATLISDLRRARGPREMFLYLFGPPGWQPNGRGRTTKRIRAEDAVPVLSGQAS